MSHQQANGPYRFTVEPRSAELGGGWRLHGYELLGSGEELEVHRELFPAPAQLETAIQAGSTWLAEQPDPRFRDGEHYMLGYVCRDRALRVGE